MENNIKAQIWILKWMDDNPDHTKEEALIALKKAEQMTKTQTAVEWLVSQVEDFYCLLPIDMIEQAKQMEKEQMIKFAMHLHDVDMSKTGTDILMDEGEQYYNETYGKEDIN